MATLKDILGLFVTQWYPGIHLKYTELCNTLSQEDKTKYLDSINLLALLLRIPGINIVATNYMNEKHGLSKEDSPNQLSPDLLLTFWEILPSFIIAHPQIALLIHNLTPVLSFDNSYKIFPHLISLRNSYLINEFISKQSNNSILSTVGYLFSSNNNELISQLFPFFLKREVNLISFCIYPEFKEEILTASLSSNLLGVISNINLSYLLVYLKNGKIKQDSKLFTAFCIYIKKFFVPDLDLDSLLTPASVFDSIIKKYPDLLNEKPFSDQIEQIIEQAKTIVVYHQTDQVEQFAQSLIRDGNCDEFSKSIASVTISSLIITYAIEKNLLIRLILFLKQIGVVEFPSFLTAKLLRIAPNQIEKISSIHAIPSIASAFVTGKLNPKIEELCITKPYLILKALYIIATFDSERKHKYDFPPEILSLIQKVNFQNLEIPKGAPSYIKKFKYNGSPDSLVIFYTNAFNDKTLTNKYFEMDKDFHKKLEKITKVYYPDFVFDSDKNNAKNNFPRSIYKNDNKDDTPLYISMYGIELPDLPEDSFNSRLLNSSYNDPMLTTTLNSVINNDDDELDDFDNILISGVGNFS